MAPDTDTDAENDHPPARVNEDKFNGTATLTVTGVDSKDWAEAFGRKYFKEQHGSRPSRVVAERDPITRPDEPRWRVMVADHSSGSLANAKDYDHPEADK